MNAFFCMCKRECSVVHSKSFTFAWQKSDHRVYLAWRNIFEYFLLLHRFFNFIVVTDRNLLNFFFQRNQFRVKLCEERSKYLLFSPLVHIVHWNVCVRIAQVTSVK